MAIGRPLSPEGKAAALLPSPRNIQSFSGLGAVCLFQLPGNPEGPRQLTFCEPPTACPFPIRRVYWLHDTCDGELRGHHAHKTLSQLLVAVSGAIDVELDDGRRKEMYRLNTPQMALFVPPMLWRTLTVRRPESVLVVLASAAFDEADYIREYSEYQHYQANRAVVSALDGLNAQ
jgi:hypothetical protein